NAKPTLTVEPTHYFHEGNSVLRGHPSSIERRGNQKLHLRPVRHTCPQISPRHVALERQFLAEDVVKLGNEQLKQLFSRARAQIRRAR
ncbi:hypothetical protein ALC60_11543, partial [Trachymyrmex zeteki]